MEHHIFVYGTLTAPDILSEVLGREYQPQHYLPATLHDYRRHAVQGAAFAVIRAAEGAWVDGFLVEHVSDDDLARLDRWQTGDLTRIQVEVTTEAGTPFTAWTYADTKGTAPILQMDWDMDGFRRSREAKAA
jgi:gamma-glutamylcyclotransferase (GGCT)/AIG2-like uncharacterized protein YtfP